MRCAVRLQPITCETDVTVGEIWPSFSTVTLDSPLVLILSLIYLWTILGVSVLGAQRDVAAALTPQPESWPFACFCH